MLKKLEIKIKNIPASIKSAFITAVITGLAAHYFMMATKLTNHDDLRETCSDMPAIFWGRWLLGKASGITGNMSLTFDCLLAVVYIAVAAALVVHTLKLRSVITSGLTGAFMATFPTLAFSNLFVSTADPYALAILLMAVSACIAVCAGNIIVGILVPIVLMTASMGIYQAYLGFCLGIMILAGISELAYEGKSFREVLLREIRYVITAGISLALYLFITKMLQKTTGIEADGYQGMDKMGELDIQSLPLQIRHAYTKSIGYYVLNQRGVHYRWLTGLFVIMAIASATVFIIHMIKARREVLVNALTAVLVILLPMAAGVIYVMGPLNVHLLMIYGFVTLALFPVMIIDRIEFSVASGSSKKDPHIAEKLVQGVVLLTLILAVYNYITLSNKLYTVNYYVYEESYSYAQTVATVIRTTPGFSRETQIYMIGKPASGSVALDEFYEDDPRLNEFENAGIDRDLCTEYTMPSFFWYYLGLTNSIKEIKPEKAADMGIPELSVFPEEGSTYMGDGYMVIRFE